MAEYIEREAFLEEKRKLYCENCKRRYGLKKGKSVVCYEIGDAPCRACEIDDVLNDVEDFPAADVRPVVRGKWKLGGYGQISDATEKWYDQFLSGCFFYCSACKERSSTKTHFCPNCGAEMECADDV